MPPKRVHGSGISKISARHRLAVGIDTDSHYLVCAFFDAEAPSKTMVKEYPQNQSGMIDLIIALNLFAPTIIVIESTANYHTLCFDSCSKAGLPIIVINPATIKAILRVTGKSDKNDALTLARIGSSFQIKSSNMANELQREIRSVFQVFDTAKIEKGRVIAKLNAQLLGAGITISRVVASSSETWSQIIEGLVAGYNKEDLLKTVKPSMVGKVRESFPPEIPAYLRNLCADWSSSIKANTLLENNAKKRILQYAKHPLILSPISLMCSVPGVTEFLALRILGEMGENFWQRYPNASSFAKGLGVVPANEVSGGKLLKRKSTHGNQKAKLHLLMAAKAWVIRPKPKHPLYQWYVSYKARSNYMKATSGVARQMAEGLYHVCRTSSLWYWKGIWKPLPTGDFVNMNTGELYYVPNIELDQSKDVSSTSGENPAGLDQEIEDAL